MIVWRNRHCHTSLMSYVTTSYLAATIKNKYVIHVDPEVTCLWLFPTVWKDMCAKIAEQEIMRVKWIDETIKMNNIYVCICELTRRDLHNILISFEKGHRVCTVWSHLKIRRKTLCKYMNEYVSVNKKKDIERCRQNKTLVIRGDAGGRAKLENY